MEWKQFKIYVLFSRAVTTPTCIRDSNGQAFKALQGSALASLSA
jgi:hypothetical protein